MLRRFVAIACLALLGAGCAVPHVASAPEYWQLPADSGIGRRLVYEIATQRTWIVGERGEILDAFRVSGRRGWPRPGTYEVFRKINPGSSGSLRLPYFVGFAYGNSTDIGFHGIPLYPSGKPIQSDEQLGQPLSHGCIRVAQDKAVEIWSFTELGTTVVVLP